MSGGRLLIGEDSATQLCYHLGIMATHGIAAKKSPCSSKSIFPIVNHYKRDSHETAHRTALMANKHNYDAMTQLRRQPKSLSVICGLGPLIYP